MEQFAGNYTGPYWSDGKLQPSVEFGTADPQSELDALSRLHDTAYAHYKDRAHREAADEIYEREAKALVGKFPSLAGNMVLHGNYLARQAKQLASDTMLFPGLPLVGLGKFALTNLWNANKMVHGTYLEKEKKDVEALYGRDPMAKSKSPPRGNDDKRETTALGLPKGVSELLAKVKKAATGNARTGGGYHSDPREPQGNKNTPRSDSVQVPKLDSALVERQAKRLAKYQQLYIDSKAPHVPKKYKKNKRNMKRAVRVVPI